MDWSALLYYALAALLFMAVVTFAVTLAIIITIFNDVRKDQKSVKEHVTRLRRRH